jgi:hypothetical protein
LVTAIEYDDPTPGRGGRVVGARAETRQQSTDRLADRKGSTQKLDDRMSRGSADRDRGSGRRR